jgi:integrase
VFCDFARTAASLLLSSGSSVKSMQELMRHATSGITLELYAQAITEDKRDAQNALAAIVAGQTISPVEPAETGIAA